VLGAIEERFESRRRIARVVRCGHRMVGAVA
jgi:hypothetical protein